MSTIYKWEAFYTSEELDLRLKSYIRRTANDLVMQPKKKRKQEVVA